MLPSSILLPLDIAMDVAGYLFSREAEDPEAKRLADWFEAKFRTLIAREEYSEEKGYL